MIIESFPGDAKPYKCNDCDTIFLWREDTADHPKGRCNRFSTKYECYTNDETCLFFSKCSGPICPVCKSKYVVNVNSFYYRITRYFRNRKEK